MIKEEWRPIFGYEGLYEVSNLGRVKSLNYNKTGKEKILSFGISNGYLQVALHKNGSKEQPLVHRLVWEAFYGKIPDGMVIDHIDTNRQNNSVENLRCVTPKENCNNPITLKRTVQKNRNQAKDPEWLNKMSEILKHRCNKPVIQLDINTGEVIKKWESASEASRQTGVNFSHISACCRGKRKTAGGSRWVFG